jgi:hypothetical protein
MFLAYQAAGIHLSIMGLDQMQELNVESSEGFALDDTYYNVEPRVTIVNDWRFYRRAHGGFGGIHGAPSYGGGRGGTITIAGGYSFGGGHGFSFGHGGG